MIPTPKFFVFYNGNEPFPSEKIMKLSDSYLEKTDPPMLELVVKVININLPNKHKLLEQCRPLYEYSWFIQKVKDYEDGFEAGEKRGKLQTLIQIITKKLAKGKNPETIADELETELTTIERICNAVQTHGADLEVLLKILTE